MADTTFNRDACLTSYHTVLVELIKLRDVYKGSEIGRHVSIAITNLETSLLWTREVLAFLSAGDKAKELRCDQIAKSILDKI